MNSSGQKGLAVPFESQNMFCSRGANEEETVIGVRGRMFLSRVSAVATTVT